MIREIRRQSLRVQLAQRKVDETAAVNARTYWSLTAAQGTAVTYELRVRHGGEEDEFKFLKHRFSKTREVVTFEESAERTRMLQASHSCPACVSDDPGGCTLEEEIERLHEGLSKFRPDAPIWDIERELMARWEAVCLLVEPAINL